MNHFYSDTCWRKIISVPPNLHYDLVSVYKNLKRRFCTKTYIVSPRYIFCTSSQICFCANFTQKDYECFFLQTTLGFLVALYSKICARRLFFLLSWGSLILPCDAWKPVNRRRLLAANTVPTPELFLAGRSLFIIRLCEKGGVDAQSYPMLFLRLGCWTHCNAWNRQSFK